MLAFSGLLCYDAPSTAFWRKRSDASVSAKALLMSAKLTAGRWATEVRSCPWPQCDSASGKFHARHMHACIYITIEPS